jgi:hypothetical protein
VQTATTIYVQGQIWIGQVSVDSGLIGVTSGEIHVMSGTVRAEISGDHVFVESGVFLASGCYVQAGGGVTSGSVVVSGIIGVSGSISVHSGLVGVQSGEIHVMSGVVQVNSGRIDIANSGVGVTVQSGVEIVWRGMQVSGIVGISGSVSIHSGLFSVQSGEVHIMSGSLSISGSVTVISGVITTTIGSGLFVTVQSGGAVSVPVTSGSVQVSGALMISGQIYMTSGTVAVFSGLVGVTSGRMDVLSGEIHVMSGSMTIDSGVYLASGLYGKSFVTSGFVQVVGSVFVSGDVGITTPTSLLINNSGNPLLLDSNSGGLCLCSGAIKSVVVKALAKNSGDVYVGGYTAGQMPYSGCGLVLAPGEAIIIDVKELGYVKCFAALSGWEYVSYLGIN